MPLRFVAHLLLLLTATCSAQLPLGTKHEPVKVEGNPTHHPRVRQLDVEHLRIEIWPSFEESRLTGRVTIEAKTLVAALDTLVFDAAHLAINSVEVNGAKVGWWSGEEQLLVELEGRLAAGAEVEVVIHYATSPEEGWMFVERPRPDGSTAVMMHTQGQTEHHRHWFPCYVKTNDLLTSEVIVHVPAELEHVVLANGELVPASEDAEEDGKPRRWHWRLDKPHTTYLIAVVVGEMDTVRTEVDGIPLGYHVPTGWGHTIEHTFGRTPPMMRLFQELHDHAYPWPRYEQAVAYGFEAGGMENTGLTILTESCLHNRADSPDYSADTLIAHELAHQWWGDLVTCEDWSHIWLHEGFATYYEALWLEHSTGVSAAQWDLRGGRSWYLGTDAGGRRPMVWRGYGNPWQVFDAHAYPKGAWVLHMLRHVVGDEAFFESLAVFLDTYEHQVVNTRDLQAVFEETTGEGLGWFFDQWLYKAGHPEYRVTQEYQEEQGILVLEVHQVQHTDAATPLFRMPIDVEVVDADGKATLHRLWVAKKEETFYLPSATRPRDVRFDKGCNVLKQIEFAKPDDQLVYQLAHDDDSMGRRAAADALVRKVSLSFDLATAVGKALAEDTDPQLREHLATELGHVVGGHRWQPWRRDWAKEDVADVGATSRRWARDQLLDRARQDEDARVRTAALHALVNFPGDAEVLAHLTTAATGTGVTSSYQQAAACLALGRIGNLQAHDEILRQALRTDTHRERVERFALRALRDLGAPDIYQLAYARAQPVHDHQLRGDAIGILEALGAKNDPQIVRILVPLAGDPDRRIRHRAIGLLGRFGKLSEGLARHALTGAAESPLEQTRSKAKEALEKLK